MRVRRRPRSDRVRASDVEALRVESQMVLAECVGQIEDGQIDGRPWMHVVLDRAFARLRRRRAIEGRRKVVRDAGDGRR